MRTLAVAAAAAAAWAAGAGCKGSTSPDNAGQSKYCTATLSGALTGSYDCRPATTVWAATNNIGGFNIALTAAGSAPSIYVSINWTGQPALQAYTNNDVGAHGLVSVATAAGASWAASVGQSSSSAGSYTLTFTSVPSFVNQSTGRAYAADGTLDAVLPAAAGTPASGAVTLHVAF